jgi:hypothetical protein
MPPPPEFDAGVFHDTTAPKGAPKIRQFIGPIELGFSLAESKLNDANVSLVTQNTNGTKPFTKDPKLMAGLENMVKHQAGIISLNETNVEWRRFSFRKGLKNAFKNITKLCDTHLALPVRFSKGHITNETARLFQQ